MTTNADSWPPPPIEQLAGAPVAYPPYGTCVCGRPNDNPDGDCSACCQEWGCWDYLDDDDHTYQEHAS